MREVVAAAVRDGVRVRAMGLLMLELDTTPPIRVAAPLVVASDHELIEELIALHKAEGAELDSFQRWALAGAGEQATALVLTLVSKPATAPPLTVNIVFAGIDAGLAPGLELLSRSPVFSICAEHEAPRSAEWHASETDPARVVSLENAARDELAAILAYHADRKRRAAAEQAATS